MSLDLGEIEEVISGMTGNVLQTTFESYLAQYPEMDSVERKYTFENLYAAQGLAMDELSAEKQEEIFEDYKSRVDLYLTEGPPEPVPDDDPAYTQVLINRVDGFLPNIIPKSDTNYLHIRSIVIRQYKDLARIHDGRDAESDAIINDKSLGFVVRNLMANLVYYRAERDVRRLHAEYPAV